MAIQVRRGKEADFDANKMLPGEWAVSLDTKYVRMCFAPGIVLRMASYESFEADMELIQGILEECEEIQTAIERIKSEIDEKASLTIEYSNSASLSATRASEEAERAYEEAERAKNYADSAQSATNVQIATKDTAGIIKGGDNYIAEDGTLTLIKNTTDFTMPNSYSGRLLVEEIGGVCEQNTTSGKQFAQDAVVGTETGIYHTSLYVKADFKPNTQYTFSFKGAVGNRYYLNENMFVEDITFTVVDGTNTFTATTKDDFSSQLFSNGYLLLKNQKDQPNQNKFEEVMVVEGATALPWEPYTGGIPSPNPSYPQEIKKSVVSEIKTHGKNMLNCQGLTEQTFRGVTFAPNYDANGNLLYVEVNGTASGGVSTYSIGTFKFDSNKPCILSGCPSGGSDSKYTIYTENSAVGTDYGSGVSITSDLSANIRIGVANGATVTNLRFYPMIRNVDVEDATYEPCCGSSFTFSKPIELNKIGDVQDVIVDGKVKRRFGEVVLNGSETIYLSANLQNVTRFYISLPLAKNNGKAICSHLIFDENFSGDYVHFKVDSAYIWLYFSNDIAKNADELMAWLTENHMTVIYELAEESTEALPTADQVALNSIKTFDGTTHLEIDSPLQPEFVAEYGTSKVGGYTLEGMLAGRNGELMGKDYANRLTALETSAVNNI